MRAIALGLALLASGVRGLSPRKHPKLTNGTRHWGTAFLSHYPPHYPVATYEKKYLSDPVAALQGHSILVDVSVYNKSGPANESDTDKANRLLLIGALCKECGAQNVLFVFDGPQKDRDAPKDDKRPPSVLAGADASHRGVDTHYQPGEHRSRGPVFDRITTEQKRVLDANGFDWVQPDEGEAELLAAALTRDPSNPFDTVLTPDMKDCICAGLATCVVDIRSDGKTLTHAFVCETHKAAEVLGIHEESLFLLQCMHGNDDEPGHELAYAAQSPYTKFKSAILDLEGQVAAIGNANDFPDVLSVLIGRVKGDERVSFTPAMDTFWGSYIGPDAGLKSPKGQATRAYFDWDTQQGGLGADFSHHLLFFAKVIDYIVENYDRADAESRDTMSYYGRRLVEFGLLGEHFDERTETWTIDTDGHLIRDLRLAWDATTRSDAPCPFDAATVVVYAYCRKR